MKLVASFSRAIRNRISEKLGVCPYCMRASALGSLASWTVYFLIGFAARWIVLPDTVRLLVLAGACAFTLLISAHLVAYMVRIGRRVRSCQTAVAAASTSSERVVSRREFMSTVLAAGAAAAAVAVLGHVPTYGQAGGCEGKYDMDADAIGIGGDETEARESYDDFVDGRCDSFCKDKPCPGGDGCVRSTVAPRVRTQPKCEPGVGTTWVCRGKVKQCSCTCSHCFGDHSLHRWLGSDYANGYGLTQAEAEAEMIKEAREMCTKECERYQNCLAPKICKPAGEPDLDYQTKKWGGSSPNSSGWSTARIKKCHCNCA